MTGRNSRHSGGWLTTLFLLPVLFCAMPVGAIWTVHRQSQQRRIAALEQYPFRLVLPADISQNRVQEFSTIMQSWMAPAGPLPDPQGRSEILTGAELARRIPLQEDWVARELSDTPLPNDLPTIISVITPASVTDPLKSQDWIERLRSLHPQGFVAHDQLALDALLTAHISQREREARLALLVNSVAFLTVICAWLAAFVNRTSAATVAPDTTSPLVPMRVLVLLGASVLFACMGWFLGAWLLG